jgi:uncharacterized membrane protein
MPPRGVKSPKRARQYEHIKESEQARGVSPRRAKQIAAATLNKQRRKAGETKTAPRSGTAGKTARKKTSSSRGGTGGSRSRGGSGRSRSTSSKSRSTSGRSRGTSRRS